jgi:hypothetical protein
MIKDSSSLIPNSRILHFSETRTTRDATRVSGFRFTRKARMSESGMCGVEAIPRLELLVC